MEKELVKKIDLDKYDFEMFSKAGNKACASAVKGIFKKLESKTRYSQEEVLEMVADGIENVGKTHGEVNDTEPEWHICRLVLRKCQEIGYNYEFSRFDI